MLSCERKRNALLVEFDEKPVNAMELGMTIDFVFEDIFFFGNNFYWSVGGKGKVLSHQREKSPLKAVTA